MAANDAYARVDSPFGAVGLVSALRPDVALLHAPIADREVKAVSLQPRLAYPFSYTYTPERRRASKLSRLAYIPCVLFEQ